jgi:hypothetical protein
MRGLMRLSAGVRGSLLAALLLAASAPAQARYSGGGVEVEIVGQDGRAFATYPLERGANSDIHRAYVEARMQARYRIRVHNRSAGRVGLVIAVDGRNIITGRKSELGRSESMYILDPWESESYEGWRTSREHVHEFYFTHWKDSYAEAFGDRSARGVIAVAVYRERVSEQRSLHREAPALAERSAADAAGSAAPVASPETQPGTGFGDEVDSPVRLVAFDAERAPAAKHFIKYEWREALCRKRVIDCERRERNRFWEEEDRLSFAPFPPQAVNGG